MTQLSTSRIAPLSAPALLPRLRRRLLGIPLIETSFARRGFHCRDQSLRLRLEELGATFLEGYHSALEEIEPRRLALRLEGVRRDHRGFAFEGAAMALAILDFMAPWRRRLAALISGPGAAHVYLIHVGAGWALARLPLRVDAAVKRIDPFLGWLMLDGWGFHDGYFQPERTIGYQERPKRVRGYARRVYDQGVGRSLWFVGGADVEWIADTVDSFDRARRADLWSGVGLAVTYAGGVEEADVEHLRVRAGGYGTALAQGAAFAAKARQLGGNPTLHTELACRVLCAMPARQAAAITDDSLDGLPASATAGNGAAEPAFELWRQRIQGCFEHRVAA